MSRTPVTSARRFVRLPSRRVRLVGSAIVLGVLLWMIPLDELWVAVRRVSPLVWLGTLMAFLAGHAIAALKWRLLMIDRHDIGVRLWLPAHFAGLAANLALPGIAGGDVVRAAWVMRAVPRAESVVVASLADRAIDALALLALASLGAALLGRTGETARVVLTSVALLLLLGLVFGIGLLAWLRRRPSSGPLGRAAAASTLLLSRPHLAAAAFALSVAVQGLLVALNARLGTHAGVNVSPGAWLLAWPLAKLVALLPISLGGIGVREAALAGFLQPFGAPASAVVAAGLLWQTILATGGLLGWGLVTMAGLKIECQVERQVERDDKAAE